MAINNIDISISELTDILEGCNIENDLAIIKLDSENLFKFDQNLIERILSPTARENNAAIFLTREGSISISIDYKEYNVPKWAIMAIPPFNIVTQLGISPDLRGYLMCFSKNFIKEITVDKKPPVSISQLLSVDRSLPFTQLSQEECSTLTTCLERINHYLAAKSNKLQKELIKSTFYTFILEAINIIFYNRSESTNQEKSIKKIYIKNFMELLIKYAEQEHNPAFYADKLCISVQYLSLILKEVSGKTATTWIAHYLVSRAKLMLRKPDIPIQEIAESLNFSDQSSFGKFFKKHTGISPKRYREDYTTAY